MPSEETYKAMYLMLTNEVATSIKRMTEVVDVAQIEVERLKAAQRTAEHLYIFCGEDAPDEE